MIHLHHSFRPAVRIVGAATLAFAAITPHLAEARGAPDSFADLAERLSPMVVNISTAQNVGRPRFDGRRPGDTDDPLERFREFFGRGPQGGMPRRVESLGSGFVVDAEGYIVTNNHVIEGADEITVNFSNGESFPAELIGADDKTDIALLRMTEMPDEALAVAALGDSDVTRVGDWVIAIGNPFGLGGSVTAGIVSARNRDINSGPYDDYIQTDASINRGNSGGPLFNMNGEVIGVNTAIFSPTGGSVGIGFAVPSNIVRTVVRELRENGVVRRGWLGVSIGSVTDDLAAGLELEEARGVLINNVGRGSPAEAGGLRRGDVILRFNGRDIEDARTLPRVVAETPVGETVEVLVNRDGVMTVLNVTIGLMTDDAAATLRPGGEPERRRGEKGDLPESRTSGAALGMAMAPLSSSLRRRHNLDRDVEGVLIIEVDPRSPAARRGLRTGDVILEVQQTPVSTPAEVEDRVRAVRARSRSTVVMLIERARQGVFYVALRLDDE